MLRLLTSILPSRSLLRPSLRLLPTAPSTTTPQQHQLIALSSHLSPFCCARGYRTRTSLKLRCENCFFCRRRGKLRVECKENPKHKQKQK
ncbi:hypothetical protein DFJ77DRAFT_462995 [Powellomyces hirtus]|nr:hypothetical protein DFJ77DRAFT_462995 [Powellomyces hirtus]